MILRHKKTVVRVPTTRRCKRTKCFIKTSIRRVIEDDIFVDVESITMWTEQRREPRCLNTVT